MNTLVIPLTSITEDGLRLDAEAPVAAIQPEGAAPLPAESLRVTGHLTLVAPAYLFRGAVACAFTQPCDRCLAPAGTAVRSEVAWTFEEGAPYGPPGRLSTEEEEAIAAGVWRHQGAEIDLRPPVWEELALTTPTKCVCREDCKGLCPRCGANLNDGPCACAPAASAAAEQGGSFAALAEMFPELSKKKTEE